MKKSVALLLGFLLIFAGAFVFVSNANCESIHYQFEGLVTNSLIAGVSVGDFWAVNFTDLTHPRLILRAQIQRMEGM